MVCTSGTCTTFYILHDIYLSMFVIVCVFSVGSIFQRGKDENERW